MGRPVRVGCSGWDYPHWRGVFYPEDLPRAAWFGHYAARFDTVEINSSFYRLPAASVVERWRAQAPAGFTYALKASRYLTHMRKLKEPEAPLERIMSVARGLGDHLGPILYQLPPRWRLDVARLDRFLASLPSGYLHVLEVRDPTWLVDEARARLDTAGVGFCVHDAAGIEVPRWVTGEVVYLRLHGAREGLRAGYPDGVLDDWAGWLGGVSGRGRPAFVYFNNDQGGHAVTDAGRLAARLAARV
jgi:uncharacterized protein YecE (DUF72 family)